MKYISTRHQQRPLSFSEAVTQGLAADGGLLIPDALPQIDLAQQTTATHYSEFAANLLRPFLEGDALSASLDQICEQAFNFPIQTSRLDDNNTLLELYHGPTASFKDVGCRFFANCINALATEQKKTVMVATSGDTGSAVAAALHGQQNIQVIILYPYQKISARQQHQITCWGDNVLALAVDGNFDDCQRFVKEAFKNETWTKTFSLTTSNSINIARILPQVVYYAFFSLEHIKKYNQPCNVIVPSGNLGNVTACYWAKAMGFPINTILMTTNANQTVPEFIQTGHYKGRASIMTLANAMDVGDPSNIERLCALFESTAKFQDTVKAVSVSDNNIIKSIQMAYRSHNVILCPHTATAYHYANKHPEESWLIAATADPSKFEAVIEPILQQPVPPCPALSSLLEKPATEIRVKKDLNHIFEKSKNHFEKKQNIKTTQRTA